MSHFLFSFYPPGFNNSVLRAAGRVTDSDGEILLIEAADCIPRWAAEPEAAEGRVYLYRGQVRHSSIVPS